MLHDTPFNIFLLMIVVRDTIMRCGIEISETNIGRYNIITRNIIVDEVVLWYGVTTDSYKNNFYVNAKVNLLF